MAGASPKIGFICWRGERDKEGESQREGQEDNMYLAKESRVYVYLNYWQPIQYVLRETHVCLACEREKTFEIQAAQNN